MKKTLGIILLLGVALNFFAQNNRINLTGTVYSSADQNIVELAGIRVLSPLDSSYVTGGAAGMDGKFSIPVGPRQYILQVSYLGYQDKYIDVNPRKTSDLGKIFLDENSILLNEAVVEAKAIEIQVKGDTIEYNADSYKVQESAVVEDLLKKMPGVEVDDEGKITVNGKEVKKILIDGKEFFTDDPKVASKNLPAKMVDKLQVLDKKSDMALMTGFDDGDEETVINLTVKPGMKEGLFGNAFAGMGNKHRYEGNGMVNYMRNSTQFTALGGINNTNNAGFSDFASAAAGGGRRMRFGGNNGVAKSINGGFNFATESSDKWKWNGNVRYGMTDNDVISNSITSYTGQSKEATSNEWGNNKSHNLGADLRLEWTPDDKTKLIFRPNIRYNTNDKFEISDEEMIDEVNAMKSFLDSAQYTSERKGLTLKGQLEFSRKLNDEGRTFSVSASGGFDNSNTDGFNYTKTIYNDVAKGDSILDQRLDDEGRSHNWRMFLSYVEPLGRNNFLQLKYSIRNNNSKTDKNTYIKDLLGDYTEIDPEYSRNVKNDFLNQNITLSFKSVREKFDYTIGLGLEPSSSKTNIISGQNDRLIPRKNFLSFAPDFQFNYRWSKRHNLRVSYSGNTSQPSTLQLNDAPLKEGNRTTIGNPNLKPSFQNRVFLRYQRSNPESASMIMVFGRFSQTMNDIVTLSSWDENNRRITTYDNINGNMDGSVRFIVNTPLRNKKFSFNSMTFASYARKNTFIDQEKNRAGIVQLQEYAGIQFRSDKFDFTVRGNISYNSINNTISKNSNQDVYNYGGSGSATWYLPFDITLESDIKYSSNSGYSNGYKLNEWLWNASLSKQVFKNKAGTIRFKIYDILKERSNISHQFNSEYVKDITTNALNSYFMVHFVYKFQIFKGGAKSGDMDMLQPRGGRGGRHHF